MKTPLHYQVSTYDCVPTCFVNALSFLFHREDIPPAVVQRIHLACYDLLGKENEIGRGSSGMAMELLAYFLESYRTPSFRLRQHCMFGEAVHLGPDNPMDKCLKKDGVMLAIIRLFRGSHCVLILDADEEFVSIHDPYRRKRQLQDYEGQVTYLFDSDGFGPNLRVTREWLDLTKPLGRFCFGPRKNRTALALWPVK